MAELPLPGYVTLKNKSVEVRYLDEQHPVVQPGEENNVLEGTATKLVAQLPAVWEISGRYEE
jgi:hypothetical protein